MSRAILGTSVICSMFASPGLRLADKPEGCGNTTIYTYVCMYVCNY